MINKKQSGTVLIISLILLFSLTFFVLSGSQTVLVQEKMTAAMRDIHVALEVAESGIVAGEEAIEKLSDVSSFDPSGSNGLYSEGHGPVDIFSKVIWDSTLSTKGYAVSETAVSGEHAKYYIEDLGKMTFSDDAHSLSVIGYGESSSGSTLHIFKIVSRSMGKNQSTERVIESYYAKSL